MNTFIFPMVSITSLAFPWLPLTLKNSPTPPMKWAVKATFAPRYYSS